MLGLRTSRGHCNGHHEETLNPTLMKSSCKAPKPETWRASVISRQEWCHGNWVLGNHAAGAEHKGLVFRVYWVLVGYKFTPLL